MIVNQDILLGKLECSGIRSIAEEIGNENSEEETISCGIPHRSVLGSLLFFLIYINVFWSFFNVLDLNLFADDSNLFFSHKKLPELENISSEENMLILGFLII